jgi:hypothetical protein
MGRWAVNPTCEAEAITLRAWAAVAKAGERRIYFTGFLARSSGMAALTSVAMDLQKAGVVHLFQQRGADSKRPRRFRTTRRGLSCAEGDGGRRPRCWRCKADAAIWLQGSRMTPDT